MLALEEYKILVANYVFFVEHAWNEVIVHSMGDRIILVLVINVIFWQ